MAQYVLNNVVHTTNGMNPNMALMGYNIPLPDKFIANADSNIHNVAKPRERAGSLIQTQNIAAECHKRALEDMKRFADQYRQDAPFLKEGNQVFLSLKHLSTKRPSKKINYLWDGPFKLSKAIGTHTYRFKIPTGSGRPPHNVFYTYHNFTKSITQPRLIPI